MNNLAMVNPLSSGKPDQAEPLLGQVVEVGRRVMGPEHPNTLAATSPLSSVLQARVKLDEAEPLYRQVLEIQHRVLGPEHPTTPTTMNNLARVLQARLSWTRPSRSIARSWRSASRPGPRAPRHADHDERAGWSAPGPAQAARGRAPAAPPGQVRK